jgi:hypothetical protein
LSFPPSFQQLAKPSAPPRSVPPQEKTESKSLTLLEIWTLLITLLVIGLIAYYAFLVS